MLIVPSVTLCPRWTLVLVDLVQHTLSKSTLCTSLTQVRSILPLTPGERTLPPRRPAFRIKPQSLDAECIPTQIPTSPLACMPIEIMSLIFMYTLPSHDAPHGLDSLQEGPWVLAAVCSQWRKIALSLPRLWATIFLDFAEEDWNSPSFEAMRPKLELHLARSQSLPLDITFRAFWHEALCRKRELPVLDLLASHSDRWETIKFVGSYTLYSHLDTIRGNLPILRSLNIRVRQEHYTPRRGPLTIFEDCPELREAYVNAKGYDGDLPLPMELPPNRLLRYSASNSWANHAHVLRGMANLVDCVLHITDLPSIPSDSVIQLPRLRRLSLSTAEALELLETPALEELYCFDHPDHLPSLLSRLPRLQKLFVADIPSPSHLAPLLHVAPAISKLCLSIPIDFAPTLFSYLDNSPPDGTESKPPALRELSLCLVPNDQPHDLDELLRSAETQWRSGFLHSFKLCTKDSLPSAVPMERLESLRDEGMEVVIFENATSLYADFIPNDFLLHTKR
ncbi:F-box domain-containing protein [Favolaschia claudopus]|uniref:F-box domain-containing protein n=1 Tax=Favolaschia claudopus TaxID=2862362 RepID=A0AAW0BGB6_9AGAR